MKTIIVTDDLKFIKRSLNLENYFIKRDLNVFSIHSFYALTSTKQIM